ncbi:MAG: metallophosphoesterase [Lachnospiraceae bacterium]|nr:metallophosphoesterase [Lachnospiraceae bacterium]
MEQDNQGIIDEVSKDIIKSKKRKNKLIALILVVLLILISCDFRLKTVKYTIDSSKVENSFKIALITDLHGNTYGKNQSTLIDAIDKENPDVVLLGGDIFDDKIDYEESEETIAILSKKYKCYYVTGNHEYWSKDVDNIISIVKSYGITVLEGDVDTININGQQVNICGVADPDNYVYLDGGETLETQMKRINQRVNREYYTLLLSHRPEYYDLYSQYGFDLVLSGHAHGGQWRIPGILNGLYAPDQGLFPKYAGGLYEYEGGTLIVSRGLDREGIKVPRIFNRPELVIINVK